MLREALQRLAADEPGQALAAASQACFAAPGVAEAHYVYGQAWSACGDERQAEQAFAAAVQRRPDWADAWVNYGVARYRQGATGEAVVAMREALRRAPDHAAAASNLGAFLRITGETEAAEALLHAAVARDPGDVGARLNLAADLLQDERAEEALALLDGEAPADAQAARQWRLQQALAQVQRGRAVEAREALAAFDALGPTPRALRPLRVWREVLLARLDGDDAAALAAAEAMAAALDDMGAQAVPEHRIRGHYDIAKLHSARADAPRAFAHWRAAHALLAQTQPFSRAGHRAFTDASVKAFTADRFRDGPRAANRDPAPVFVVGLPRSGTTLCERILAAHRDVHGAGEREALRLAFLALGGGGAEAPARVAALDGPALDRAAEAYLAELHALAPGAVRIVDKMPGNLLHLGLVGLMLPGAKVIHCRRDPRDVGLSIFTFRFHGDHGYAHDLGDLGWTIRERERLAAHWAAAAPGMVLTVDLADWVQDFDATLARVLAHLGLPPDDDCARFHEQDAPARTVSRAQVRQPIDARGLGRWRAYETELAPLIAELDTPAA